MTNEEQAVTIVRKAKAWDALVSVLEAYTEPELSGVKTGVDALDGFIAVYQRQKAENARLAAKLESIAGALADSGIDFKTTDAAEAVRELTRERDRLAALVESGRRAIASEVRDIARRIGPARLPEAIRDELDALANKLEIWSRPALLAALGEPTNAGQSGERE